MISNLILIFSLKFSLLLPLRYIALEKNMHFFFSWSLWFSVSVSKVIVLCNSPWISFTLLNHNHIIYGILHARKHWPNEVLRIKTMKASSQHTFLVSIFPIWMILKLVFFPSSISSFFSFSPTLLLFSENCFRQRLVLGNWNG